MSQKGQVSIIYMVITIAIAFVVATGVFLFARSFRSNISEDIGEIALENVAQQLENTFLDLKHISDTTNTSTANLTINIPKEIGERQYTISASNSTDLEIRIIGDPSTFRLLEIEFWENLTVNGFVDSSQGFVQLNLNNATEVLLK
jgi:FlaG/FlaF family flagellin (archaellin)